jgi:hypothetical protein
MIETTTRIKQFSFFFLLWIRRKKISSSRENSFY